MSFYDDFPPYISLPPPYAAASQTDAIVISVAQESPVNNEPFIPHSPIDEHDHDHDHVYDHDELASFTRAKATSFERDNNNHSNSNALPCPPRMMMMHPQSNNNNNNPSSNRVRSRTSHIFFKTRLCAKFRAGSCRNGENCNFAHGVEDMRQAPPNWQELVGVRGNNDAGGNWDDDQKIIQKMKICKKYYNGEECPYGERCHFLHEDPAMFRDDSDRIKESSVINIGTNGSPKSYLNGYDHNNSETNMAVAPNMGLNTYRGNVRSTFWKTKLCIKWETTGNCPFGEDCHFAHGQSELNVLGGRTETEAASAIPIPIPIPTYANSPSLPKLTSVPVIDAAPAPSKVPSPPREPGKNRLSKWNGTKKINRIYGDWIDDDLPL